MKFDAIPAGETWLTTRQAAIALGISEWSLRKYANSETGFLSEGEHFKKGPFRTSRTAWHMEKVKDAMLEQGYSFFSQPVDQKAIQVRRSSLSPAAQGSSTAVLG